MLLTDFGVKLSVNSRSILFFFQSGVCPVCLENGGESLPCCKAQIHSHCLQDWIWQGCSIECPCCKRTIPQSLVQRLLFERFQRLPEMKANFIEVSLSKLVISPPTSTKKTQSLKTSFLLPSSSLQGLKESRQRRKKKPSSYYNKQAL